MIWYKYEYVVVWFTRSMMVNFVKKKCFKRMCLCQSITLIGNVYKCMRVLWKDRAVILLFLRCFLFLFYWVQLHGRGRKKDGKYYGMCFSFGYFLSFNAIVKKMNHAQFYPKNKEEELPVNFTRHRHKTQ